MFRHSCCPSIMGIRVGGRSSGSAPIVIGLPRTARGYGALPIAHSHFTAGPPFPRYLACAFLAQKLRNSFNSALVHEIVPADRKDQCLTYVGVVEFSFQQLVQSIDSVVHRASLHEQRFGRMGLVPVVRQERT